MEQESGSVGDLPAKIGDAAAASSEVTVDAIDKAAAINDDPQVAEALDEAAIAADTTASRVGWVQRFLHRLSTRSR